MNSYTYFTPTIATRIELRLSFIVTGTITSITGIAAATSFSIDVMPDSIRGPTGPMGPSGSSTTPIYTVGTLTAQQTTNIGNGDHIKFNSVGITDGSNLILLDTTSAYSNFTNTASVGRITLTAGATYILTCV